MANQFQLYFEYETRYGKTSIYLLGIRQISTRMFSNSNNYEIDILYVDKEHVGMKFDSQDECEKIYQLIKQVLKENGDFLLEHSFVPSFNNHWQKRITG